MCYHQGEFNVESENITAGGRKRKGDIEKNLD